MLFRLLVQEFKVRTVAMAPVADPHCLRYRRIPHLAQAVAVIQVTADLLYLHRLLRLPTGERSSVEHQDHRVE